ncbi:MAG: phosphoribosyl-ATP diphosphatase [Treponema sp.]|jgi:phosphoribosyl-ATP pyrophosphohydrolase/phosphoribosyl-AMP cyclohydrolase|nr:phosphoribosyl-ATP diphosphatase [Treponema sp.]
MVVASIDIQNGRVVQLKQGRELVLQRDNALELVEEFDKYGEVAVIDLDAAMNRGNNLNIVKSLLRRAECRVGGGIRTVEQAKELVSLGAKRIIVGSQAFRDPAKKGAGIAGGEFAVNTAFLEALARAIGRERLIVAIDAASGTVQRTADSGADTGGTNVRGTPGTACEIVVDGWKTPTGLPLTESARTAAAFAGGLLFTCVDREGTMTGMDLTPVRALREAVPETRITAAGGVSSMEEIAALACLDCDVQLGMALYTGRISLAEAFVESLNWNKCAGHSGGLISVIAQSSGGQVLMTGYADREAVAETFKRGSLCFHSRTRNRLWMKGENSGSLLQVKRLRADCDRDALLAEVDPVGPVCHTGDWSCFGVDRRYTWDYLQAIIAGRFRSPTPGSYTATLDHALVREKIMEEAEELCTAKTRDEVIWEAADLLYFATALITREGVSVEEILDELDRRHKK